MKPGLQHESARDRNPWLTGLPMTLAFDLPACHSTPLGRRDPRWKLMAFVVALAAVCLLRTLPTAAVALGGALVLAAFGRLPGAWLARRLGTAAVVVLLFALTLPFLSDPGGAAWEFFGLRLSHKGFRLGVQLVLKSLALVTLALVLLATTPLPALLHASRRLRVPGLLVQLGLLTYRYVFVLADELRRLRVALRARGYRTRLSRHTYRTVGHVTGTLLVRGQERAERVAQAMRCRGFDGQFRSLAEFRSRPADVLFGLLLFAAACGLVLGDYFLS